MRMRPANSASLNFPVGVDVNNNLVFFQRKDNFPIVNASFTGDSTIFKQFGPISGRRYQIGASFAPDLQRDQPSDFRRGGFFVHQIPLDEGQAATIGGHQCDLAFFDDKIHAV